METNQTSVQPTVPLMSVIAHGDDASVPVQSGTTEKTKTIITILLLVFLSPIGVIVMWIWPKWPIWLKIVLTVLPIVLAVGLFFFLTVFLAVLNPQERLRQMKCAQSCPAGAGQNICLAACGESPTPKDPIFSVSIIDGEIDPITLGQASNMVGYPILLPGTLPDGYAYATSGVFEVGGLFMPQTYLFNKATGDTIMLFSTPTSADGFDSLVNSLYSTHAPKPIEISGYKGYTFIKPADTGSSDRERKFLIWNDGIRDQGAVYSPANSVGDDEAKAFAESLYQEVAKTSQDGVVLPTTVAVKETFVSEGEKVVDTDITAHVTSAVVRDGEITISATFRNTGTSQKDAKLSIAMFAGGMGNYEKKGLLSATLTPGQQRSFDMRFEAKGNPPYSFVYNGTVVLATFAP